MVPMTLYGMGGKPDLGEVAGKLGNGIAEIDASTQGLILGMTTTATARVA